MLVLYNFIFQHMTDEIFRVSAPFSETPIPHSSPLKWRYWNRPWKYRKQSENRGGSPEEREKS